MKQAKTIIWGIVLIAFGIIFGGNSLGLFNIDVFFDGWWTLFIIVPGIVSLITDDNKLGSVISIAIGVIFLLAARNVFDYDVAWKAAVALILIFAGLTLVFHNIFRKKINREIEKEISKLSEDKEDEFESIVAIFSGNERTYNNEEFTGAATVAVFGGADLDLRNAEIKQDVVIKAVAVFGGVDITVPEDAKVKIKSGFAFGGISDDRKHASEKGKHTIYIDAAGAFGGVSINEKPKK